MQKAIVAIVVIAILGAGGFLVAHNKKNTPTTTTNNTTQTTTPTNNTNTQSNQTTETPAANTITYSNSGFSPSTLTVKSGDKVTVKNTSDSAVQVESDPHPIHTDDTDLNVGLVEAGQSKTFTVTKTGTFGYHNHLNPSETGKITIQ